MASDTTSSTVRAWDWDTDGFSDAHGPEADEASTAATYNLWGDIPAGWAMAGEGTQRALLRAPSGRCWKVPHAGQDDVQAREVLAWHRLGEAGWAVPAHTLYRADVESYPGYYDTVPVILVEYVEADGTEADVDAALDALADLRVVDLNPSNIVVRGGEAVIIDAGGVG